MSVTTSSTTSTTSTSQSAAKQPTNATGSNALGKNEFLKILTAQLAHQDPTAPMDSNAFVAQLAQFSALEEQQNTNDTLTQMLALQSATNQTDAVSVAVASVGKYATYNASQMTLSTGGNISVSATLAAPATDVEMEVDDANGKQVRRQPFGPMAGTNTLTWDGCNDSGLAQPPGTYTIKVTATDASGNPVAVTQQSSGLITGVTFQNGVTQLIISGTPVSLSDVNQIQATSNAH
jgi:flagellar basal-body rod modification protein FlgD